MLYFFLCIHVQYLQRSHKNTTYKLIHNSICTTKTKQEEVDLKGNWPMQIQPPKKWLLNEAAVVAAVIRTCRQYRPDSVQTVIKTARQK